ncbi:hypothetical protein V8J88_10875 [Massilia sp. W12]|uniref:hypothetical protein n=1 Tax=Massilia sp. W12 TaxID=3126507 RepID=UPI0030D1A519
MRKTALSAQPAATATPAQSAPIAARVVAQEGAQYRLQTDSGEVCASLATHLPPLAPGQDVLIAGMPGAYLVIAAWPHPDAPPLLQMQEGRLRIHAAQLQLDALQELELVCGDARIRLNLAGQVQISGNHILSSAVHSQRIEGGSIDLN